MEKEVKPLLPRRKDLPCEFAVSKSQRNGALGGCACALLLGVPLIAGAVSVDETGARVVMGVTAAIFVAGAFVVGSLAFTSVRMDDEGLLVRKLGRLRRVRWDEVAKISFGATRKKSNARVGGVAGRIVRAVADSTDHERVQDPYLVGRVRQSYEPSAALFDANGRGLGSFSSFLGWGFFTALFAEADARQIRIVRTS